MLGDSPFGTENPVVGNPLIYPRRIVLSILRQFFAQPEVPNTGDCVGINPYVVILRADKSQDYDNSTLLISDAYDSSSVGKPQIIVNRTSAMWQNIAVDDSNGPSPYIASKRTPIFSDILEVGIQISVIATGQIEAENLVWLSGLFIKMFEQQIRQSSAIHRTLSFNFGPAIPDKIDSTYERFRVEASGSMFIPINWRKSTTIKIEDILNNPCALRDEEGCPVPITTICVQASPSTN